MTTLDKIPLNLEANYIPNLNVAPRQSYSRLEAFVLCFLIFCPASVHHLKLHEGRKLAVCLRLPSSRNSRLPGSRWVLYCLQDLTSLARLYLVVKSAMARCRSMYVCMYVRNYGLLEESWGLVHFGSSVE